MISPTLIQALEVVLLIASILAVGRVFLLVGDLQKTVASLESTRNEVNSTLKRIEAVADATELLMRTEITPTLKVARETLANVEVTTRAIAESTLVVRKLAASIESAQQFFSVGGPIAQAVLKKVSSGAGGFLSGLSKGLSSVLGKGKSHAAPAAEIAQSKSEDNVAIPGTSTTNPVLAAQASGAAKSEMRRK